MQINPANSAVPLLARLRALRESSGRSYLDLAAQTGLSRFTVAAAEGKADPRLSTLVALFDELGYQLVPVPKPLVRDTVRFIENGGRSVSLPAGVSAPLGMGQRAFLADPDAIDAADGSVDEGTT